MNLRRTNVLHFTLVGSAVCAMAGVVGCGSQSTSSGTASNGLTPGGASSVYVLVPEVLNTSGSALQFAANANGNVSPITTLTAPTGMVIGAVATDSSGQIYLAGFQTGPSSISVAVYAAGSNGEAKPLRTIIANTGSSPTAITVDKTGLLYLTDVDGNISVFSGAATGAATPVRFINGGTTANSDVGLAVDSSGTIYVTNQPLGSNPKTGVIYVYAPGANGAVAPVRTITNANPFEGLAVDSSGNLYASLYNETADSSSIVEFAPGASGAATPIKTIAGSATGLSGVGGLAIDSVGNIYTTSHSSSGVSGEVAFPPTASGNAAPAVSFNSSSWGNYSPPYLAVH